MSVEHDEVGCTLQLDMGQRPRRQRRHLPTSIVSAVDVQKKQARELRRKQFFHLPLLNMPTFYRQQCPDITTEYNSEDANEGNARAIEIDKDTNDDSAQSTAISTAYRYREDENNSFVVASSNITLRSNAKKPARRVYTDQPLKSRARQFMLASSESTTRNARACPSLIKGRIGSYKRYVYCLIIILWTLFILYRLFMSISNHDHSYLNFASFFQKR